MRFVGVTNFPCNRQCVIHYEKIVYTDGIPLLMALWIHTSKHLAKMLDEWSTSSGTANNFTCFTLHKLYNFYINSLFGRVAFVRSICFPSLQFTLTCRRYLLPASFVLLTPCSLALSFCVAKVWKCFQVASNKSMTFEIHCISQF